ncbi:hypothetical protein H0H92_008239 [Tricholoma furcatifolium]|nr:hypothetical protein H0H92_008239 [Tricholoma furcatifolium]
MDGAARGILDGGRVFDPNIHTKEALGKSFRVLTKAPQLPPDAPRTVPRWSHSMETVDVYTDGSCLDNGTTTAKAGAGVWFGRDDERNTATRLPDTVENTNNTGEAVAVLIAARKAQNDKALRVRTDSLVTLECLTENLQRYEDAGWVGVENRDILKAVVSQLRSRSGFTILIKVKGHSGDEGNEEADPLANIGARMPPTTPLDLEINPNFVHSGVNLWTASQKIIYAGMLEDTPPPKRRTTDTNLERMRGAIEATTGTSPTDSRLWRSLHNKTLTKETRSFLWRVVQNTYKIGTFWERIENYERRGICPACETTESMEHILTECTASGQEEIWALAGELCSIRGIEWSRPSFGEILASQMVSPTFKNGKMTMAGRRMYAITVSESARQIWKLRCEWRISKESKPELRPSVKEIRAKWCLTMYRRIRIDCLATTPTKSRREVPLEARMVQDTWSNILEKDIEPHAAWKNIPLWTP